MNTQGALQVYDGFDNKGDLKWVIEPGYSRHYNFTPPIYCQMGIFVANDAHIASYVIAYHPVPSAPFES